MTGLLATGEEKEVEKEALESLAQHGGRGDGGGGNS